MEVIRCNAEMFVPTRLELALPELQPQVPVVVEA